MEKSDVMTKRARESVERIAICDHKMYGMSMSAL